MPVTFFDPAEKNDFGYKQLYIVSAPMVAELLDGSVRTLDERRSAAHQRQRGKLNDPVPLYGGGAKPDENTLIVISQGG